MNRRTFLHRSGWLLTAWLGVPLVRAAGMDPLDRIGMGTVLFRYRFDQTRPTEHPRRDDRLTLLDVPAYYRERFRLRNVEFWSQHFESLEPAYLAELRRRLEHAGSTLVNVQVDSAYNLAAADEDERRESVREAIRWIEAAAALGAQAIRINPGHGEVATSIRSLREVNTHARRRGLRLLTENHFGIEMDPDVHLRINREAGPENLFTLPDFGNYPDDARFEALAKILPHAGLISAKAVRFNDRLEHVSFDFDRCVRMAEAAGFRGVYSVEQWSREYQDLDYAAVGDWLIAHVRDNLT